jgi:AraC-like DNA-binding protein/quercetin dioxygenase-like cupin family protein
VAEDKGMTINGEKKRSDRKQAGNASPFPYARMQDKWDALDRLDLRFRWGPFVLRVLRCHLVFFPPGQIINFHKHSEFELHFIPKGKGKVILIDQPYDLHEGLFYVTAPDVVHYQESDADDPMYELCLHCEVVKTDAEAGTGDELEWADACECIDFLGKVPAIPVVDRHHAMNVFLEAYRTWEEQPIGFYTSMKQSIVQILLRAARAFDGLGGKAGIPERDMNFHRYQLATQYMEDNEGLPISLEQVAGSISVSPRQLQRIFRSEGQTTFRDYLEHVRLKSICSELIHTDRPIELIALDHGYANPNYLYPVFKNKFDLTPTAYRKLHASEGKEGKRFAPSTS